MKNMDSEKQLCLVEGGQRRRFLNSEFSSAATTPLQRIISKQQIIFPAPGWTMLRQFSCKQLCRKGSVAQVTHEQICLVSDNGNIHYVSNSRRDAYVPPFSSTDFDEKRASLSPKNHSRVPFQLRNCEKWLKWWLFCGMLLLVVACISMVLSKFVSSDNEICHYTLKTNVLEQVLKYKLFGQEHTSKEIVTHLIFFSVSEGPRVETMVFYGDTGVGKTYTASMIGKYFTWPKNVQHIIPSVREHSVWSTEEVLWNLSHCGDNLVILDGLSMEHAGVAVQFIDELSAASISAGFRVLLILIFNVQQNYGMPMTSRLMIESTFKHKANLILFQPLEEHHIIMCVREALSKQGLTMSKADIDELLSILIPLHTGCKSVAGKVTVMGRK